MKRLLLVFPLLFALAASRASADIVDDIIALAQKDVSVDVIIAFIDHNAADLRDLKAADIARMMDAQVPDRVVEAVLRRQYGMPPEPASQASKPQESTPQEPRTSYTEETATPPQSEDYVTYVTDTPYPVPIFYEAPVFAFGVDFFGFPHLHRRFDSSHRRGDSFPPNHQPGRPDPDRPKAKLPHYGWTSAAPPEWQSLTRVPDTAQAGRPIRANTTSRPATIKEPAQARPAPERATLAPVRATRTPSQIAPAPVQVPVARETRSSGASYSGGSYSRERAVREGRR